MKAIKKSIKSQIEVLFFMLFISTVFSCNRGLFEEEYTGRMISINVPEDVSKVNVSWEDFSELEEVVILETTEECLISNIDKLLYHNKKYFILDWKAKSIYIFSENGSYIQKINNEGGGPGEYRELRDFDIDREGNLHILDYRRILVFNEKLNFQKYIHLESEFENDMFIPLKIIVDPNLDYYLWKGSFGLKEIPKGDPKKAMFKVSKTGKILETHINFNSPTNNNLRFFEGPKQIINIAPVKGNDTIYSIENSQVQPRFFIDFGEKSIAQLKDSKEESFGNLSNIVETNDHLYFNFSGNKNIFVGLYSKQNKKIVVDELKFGKEYSLGRVIGSYNNSLISVIDSYIINMTFESIMSNVKNENNRDKLKNLQGLDRENNPVLLVHKIAGF